MFLQNAGQLSMANNVLHLRKQNSSNTFFSNLTEQKSDVSETGAHFNHQYLLVCIGQSVSLLQHGQDFFLLCLKELLSCF